MDGRPFPDLATLLQLGAFFVAERARCVGPLMFFDLRSEPS